MEHTHVMVYPVSIDSSLQRSGGRKTKKEDGLPAPNPQCMARAAGLLGFETIADPDRRHPRNFWQRGRISVKFFQVDHTAVNIDIPNRGALYKAIAAKVKQLGNTVTVKQVPQQQKLRGVDKTRAMREAAKRRK
jgi:signal recognition particle subunit SRP19